MNTCEPFGTLRRLRLRVFRVWVFLLRCRSHGIVVWCRGCSRGRFFRWCRSCVGRSGVCRVGGRLLRVGQPTEKGNFQKKVLAHLPIHKKPLLLRSETVPPVSRQEAKREERVNRSQYPLLWLHRFLTHWKPLHSWFAGRRVREEKPEDLPFSKAGWQGLFPGFGAGLWHLCRMAQTENFLFLPYRKVFRFVPLLRFSHTFTREKP